MISSTSLWISLLLVARGDDVGGGGSSWMGDGIDVDTTAGVQADDGRVTVRSPL